MNPAAALVVAHAFARTTVEAAINSAGRLANSNAFR
jgi:copper(I)-binding protein